MQSERPKINRLRGKRVALVLGGGGLKGFAHLGVLRALEERGVVPTSVAGTSIGALIGAAFAAGMPQDEMTARAEGLQRRHLFQLNHVGMLLEQRRVKSIYLAEPLHALCRGVLPDGGFDDLRMPTIVNTVDLDSGTLVPWGAPGLRDVSVRDAVYASCALPGFFPPGFVGGRYCIDGGTIDNLPVRIGSVDADLVIAVDVGKTDLVPMRDLTLQGFVRVFGQAATVMMQALQQGPLDHWTGPPMLLVRPRVSHIDRFAFGHTEELVEAGYRAALAALDDLDTVLDAAGGIYPRRALEVTVDRARCTGCGLCVSMAPHVMALDANHKAYALTRRVEWSPADGDFVRHCPTEAIMVEAVQPRVAASA
jgi:NTE family protein